MLTLIAIVAGQLTIPANSCDSVKTSFQNAECCGNTAASLSYTNPYPLQHEATQSLEDLKAMLTTPEDRKPAKNVVVLLADGVSHDAFYAARLQTAYERKANGQDAGQSMESYRTHFDKMPKTYTARVNSVNAQVPDSGAAGASMFSGVKQANQMINVKPTVALKTCVAPDSADAILPLSKHIKQTTTKKVGIVTNTRVTHATPAAVYAVSGNREWENDVDIGGSGCDASTVKSIGKQMEEQLADGTIDVMMGAGYAKELKKQDSVAAGTFGQGYTVVNQGAAFHAFDWNKASSTSVLFLGGSNMSDNSYSAAYVGGMSVEELREAPEPSYKEMTLKAIAQLKAKVNADSSSDGYFLMSESGILDWSSHANHVSRVIKGVQMLDETIGAVQQVIGDDTLLIVVADHGQSMTFTSFTGSGNSPIGYATTQCKSTPLTPDWNDMKMTDECVFVDASGRPMTAMIGATGPGGFPIFQQIKNPHWNAIGWKDYHADPRTIFKAFNAPGETNIFENVSCVVDSTLTTENITGNTFPDGQSIPLARVGTCLSQEQVSSPTFHIPTVFTTAWNSHSPVDTVNKCSGPQSFLCSGNKDNTYLGVVIRFVLGVFGTR